MDEMADRELLDEEDLQVTEPEDFNDRYVDDELEMLKLVS